MSNDRDASPDVVEAVDVLLVDDQASGLAALEATLEPLHQRLHLARSGREALRLMLERDFAVILLDVMMPEMDGFETARLIRERERSSRTPIIFLTALQEGGLPQFQAYSLGAVDYLLKPFEPDILRSKVAVFADLARKTEQVRRSAEALREAERVAHEQRLQEVQQRFESAQLRAREQLLQKQMEAGLDQQRWLEAILDVMPTALVMFDPVAPKAVFANRAARGLAQGALARVDDDGVKGFCFTDGKGRELSTTELPAHRAARGERLNGVQVDFQGPSSAGSVLAYSERLGALHGHPETVLLTLLDVSELKHIEAELHQAVRAREDFLAVASHELRTPLTALKLQVSNALRSWARPDRERSHQLAPGYLHQIEGSVGRLIRLTDYLLDVSRLSTGNLELRTSSFDLGELVKEVVARLETERVQSGCEMKLSLAEAMVGSWDRERLDQALTNLLANALKYAPGHPVEVEARVEGSKVLLSVRDFGEGISPDRLPRLFERFERATQPDDSRGFGLGLWIVREIINRHGGQIEVESELGIGTAFKVALPYREKARGDDPLPSAPRPQWDGRASVQRN